MPTFSSKRRVQYSSDQMFDSSCHCGKLRKLGVSEVNNANLKVTVSQNKASSTNQCFHFRGLNFIQR